MARLRVNDQALRNFLSVLFGFALGGVNNLVILPWAFAGDLGEWGLVRIVMAWGTLIAPILLFGAPAAMNRYSGVMGRKQQIPQLIGTLIRPSIVLFAACIALPAFLFPDSVSKLLQLGEEQRSAVQPIAILVAIIMAQLFLASFLSTKLKTSLSTFFQETVFKLGYAGLALSLGLGYLSKPHFLPAFIGLNFFVLLALLAQALANQFKVDLRGLKKSEHRKEIRHYGGALMIGSSAIIILNQLDIIMVGSLLGLDQVPVFTVAVFIATVTALPTRASIRLLTPLISRALDQHDADEIKRLTQLSHRTLLLGCGWVLTCLWVATPEIDQLIPSEFQGLSMVILALGSMKLIQGSSTGSSVLLSQSNHYQKVMVLNWGMLAVAIPLNLLFIPQSGLGLGVLGAALATLITVGLSTLAKQVIIWHIWKRFVPNVQTLMICGILLIPAVSLVHWTPSWHPVIALLVKSTVVTAWAAFGTIRFNLAPEGVQFILKKAPWLSRRN